MTKYPTGVESHEGNLRLWFIYQGVRVRESLGVPDTPKNRKVAGELRTSKRAGIRHRRAYESRHTYACWSLGFGVNPNFVANQMGHASAQMVYNVYGKWMIDNNSNQLAILNTNFSDNAPPMPHAVNQ